MRLRRALPLLAVCACLSTPPPRQVGSPDAGMGLPDAPPELPDAFTGCQPPAQTVPFPPPGDILVWPGGAADFDCDGLDDLVLLVRADGLDEDKQGVYILVGDDQAVFVPTGADDPHGLLVADLGGDAHLDLLVLGGRDSDGDPRVNEIPRLLAFTGQAGLAFAAVGAIDLPGMAPEVGAGAFSAAWLEVLSLDGDAAPDLMLSFTRTLLMAELAPWGTPAILAATPEALDPGGGNWSGGQLVAFPSPAQPGYDDLVFNNRIDVQYFSNPGDGSRWTASVQGQAVAIPGGFLDSWVLVDLDGNGIPEGLGANKVDVNAPQAAVVRITASAKALRLFAEPIDGQVENVTSTVAAALDPGTGPDLAILDKRAADARLAVRPDVVVSGDDAVSGAALFYVFPSLRPDFLVAGNFVAGGGLEIMAVSHAGARACLTVSATAVAACP